LDSREQAAGWRFGAPYRALKPRKGDAVHREHEEDAFYLAKWMILGLGAFGVSLLICAIFI
jgi:hypothetical protein